PRVVAKRLPLPLKTHLVSDRACVRIGGPIGDPLRVPCDEGLELGCRHACARLREQFAARSECGQSAIRRAGAVGLPEWHYLPPQLACGLEPVDEPVRLLAQATARQRRRMQEDAARTREVHKIPTEAETNDDSLERVSTR